MWPKGHNRLSDNLYDNLPVAIYTCDKLGHIDSYNKAAEKLWGRAPVIGEECWCGSWKMFHSNGEPMALDECPMAMTLKNGVAIEGQEIIIGRADGARVNIMPFPVLLYEEGIMTGAVNTLIDITEQAAGRSRARLLAALIESSEDAIISKSLEGIVTSWNPSAQQLFGYTEEEMFGQSISLLIPKDRMEEETLILQQIGAGEKVGHFETIRVGKNKLPIAVSLTISPIKNLDGKVIGASKIVRNISQQKIAEEKLQRYAEHLAILNSIDKLVSESLDIRDILQNVTDATTSITGAAYAASFYTGMEGEPIDMLFTLSGNTEEALAKFGMLRNVEAFSSIFSGSRVIRSSEKIQGTDPSGFLAVAIVSKANEIIGGLFYAHPDKAGFTNDHENLVMGVAVQAAIALENAKLYEEIRKLNSKKDEFIGLASHELKTPLTSLNGYLQIVDRELKDSDGHKIFIKKALLQVNKLSRLVADLLDVSKIEMGKLPLNFSSFDIRELVAEVIDLMQYSIRTHRIELKCDLDQLLVRADKQRIEQVIINLVSNAIKYSSGTDLVNVMVCTNGNKASIAIQDFGIGINRKQQERIFSRFYRVDDIATHISGLGIGLYISKEIISRHHGQIMVTSEPGRGSTFTFEIPIG